MSYDDIPPEIARRALLVLADDAACAIAAPADCVSGRSVAAGGEAAVLGAAAWRAERSMAAMNNAIRANWDQLDEGHRSVMCHAGLYTFPPALAEAEAENLSFADLLRAIVLGYETVCRTATTWRFSKPSAHPHAMWSALGSAATLAILRGYGAKHFRDAVTAAITAAMAGPFRHAAQGSLITNAWCGLGVATGFHCADLGVKDIGGNAFSFDEVLADILGSEPGLTSLHSDLGTQWALQGSYHKLYPCAQQTHAAVEAILGLRAQHPDFPARIVEYMEIATHALAVSLDDRSPATPLGARFSLPHIAASAWLQGPAGLDALGGAALADTSIAQLRHKIRLRERLPGLPPPHDRAATITIRFLGGATIRTDCLSAQGGPDRPLSEREVLLKAQGLRGGRFPEFYAAIEALLRDPSEARGIGVRAVLEVR